MSLKTFSENFSTIPLESSLLDALKSIDASYGKITLVVDKNSELVGTLTDGDLRRAILKQANLLENVASYMNTNFFSVRNNIAEAEAISLMKSHSLMQLPVIDEHRHVLGIYLLRDFNRRSNQKNPVVIMAGGLGKRLLPLTERCPKPMLPIHGKPLLEIIIGQCKSLGYSDIYISVNYLKTKIINYFEDGSKFDVNIQYLCEDQPLGTAGSLSLLPKNIEEPIFVINGDVLTQLDLSNMLSFHIEANSALTIGVRTYQHRVPYGVIKAIDSKYINIEEKPTYNYLVNSGIYIINPEVLNLIPSEEHLDMPDLINKSKKHELNVNVCPIHEYWLDVGNPDTFRLAEEQWLAET